MSGGDSPQWRQRVALSWQAMSELARRHPRGAIFQEWPASGYDELMFVDGPDQSHEIIGFNRDGSVHIQPEWYEAGAGWWHVSVSGARRYAIRMETAAGLTRPATTPATSRKTLAYRVLSAICSQSLLTDVFLDPRPGYTASSDWAGIEDHYFTHFPEAAALMTRDAEPFGSASGVRPPHHYWFLVPYQTVLNSSDFSTTEVQRSEKIPVAAIDIGGTLWMPTSVTTDLMRSYQRLSRAFLPLMLEVFAILAPGFSSEWAICGSKTPPRGRRRGATDVPHAWPTDHHPVRRSGNRGTAISDGRAEISGSHGAGHPAGAE